MNFMEKLLTRSAENDGDFDDSKGRGIEAARAVMERHYAEPLNLDRLSSAAGLSKYHFLRSFSRRTGMSPHNYLLALRVARARELLTGGCRLSDAALRTGFVDQSHFSNRFKMITGLTPNFYCRSRNFTGRPD